MQYYTSEQKRLALSLKKREALSKTKAKEAMAEAEKRARKIHRQAMRAKLMNLVKQQEARKRKKRASQECDTPMRKKRKD